MIRVKARWRTAQLEALAEVSPDKRDTTPLMAPLTMPDFLDFNDSELADELVDGPGGHSAGAGIVPSALSS